MKTKLNFRLLAVLLLLITFNLFGERGNSAFAQEEYVKVTDVSDLQVNEKVVIVASDYDVALSTNQKTNNRGQTTVTKSGDKVTWTGNVQILTLEKGNINGTFAFNTGSGYLYAASSSSNHLKTQNSLTDNSSWTISISNGVAEIIAQGDNTHNKLMYNQSSELFSCYISGQKEVSLYKSVSSGEPSKEEQSLSFSVSTVNVSLGEDFTEPTLNGAQTDVSYTSSNTDVASVDTKTGDITIVGVGTTTITATAAESDDYYGAKATYELIVSNPNVKNVTFDFTNPGSLGYPDPKTGEAGAISFEANVKKGDVTMSATHGGTETRFWNSNGKIELRVYKNGGSITFSVPDECVIEKIEFTGSNIVNLLVKDIAVENRIWEGNERNVTFTATGTANIKTATITYIKYPFINISSVGYATFYTDQVYKMPEGLEGAIISAVDGVNLAANYCYQSGDVVPANTALLIRGAEGKYICDFATTEEIAPEGNMLHGLLEDGVTTSEVANAKYYKLANDSEDGLGFYWGADNGGAFNIQANKAYLVVPGTSAVRGFSLKDMETTGVVQVKSGNAEQRIYDINGRVMNVKQMNALQKGIYVVNGKKYIVK